MFLCASLSPWFKKSFSYRNQLSLLTHTSFDFLIHCIQWNTLQKVSIWAARAMNLTLRVTSWPLRCYEDCIDSDWHYHENSFFTFVLNGSCLENRKHSKHEWKPGDVLFYEKGVIHRNCYHQENSRNFNLELNDKWLEKYDVCLSNDPGSNVLGPQILNSCLYNSTVNS